MVGLDAPVWDTSATRPQGGDWGAMVTTCIGIQDPANCVGIHLNMPIALPDPATANNHTEKEKAAIAGMQHYNDWDSGYSKQQSTRPPDGGLWPERLSGGATRVDPGEVLVLDRLRWTSGKRTDPRRTARQRDAVLAAGKRRIFSASLLGKLPLSADGSGYDSGRLLDFSKRDFPDVETLGGEKVYKVGLLQRTRERRALRRIRTAGDLRA